MSENSTLTSIAWKFWSRQPQSIPDLHGPDAHGLLAIGLGI
jgi:hypothetical protein